MVVSSTICTSEGKTIFNNLDTPEKEKKKSGDSRHSDMETFAQK